MDLKQRKLNRSEWNSIEIAVSKEEMDVLHMIISGYHNVNVKVNNNHSIFTFLKIEYTEKMEDQLYNKFLRERVEKIEERIKKINLEYKNMKIDGISRINSVDKIRLERYDEHMLKKQDIYEFVLLCHIEYIFFYKDKQDSKRFHFHYYTLHKLIQNNIQKINRHVVKVTETVLSLFEEEIDISTVIENAVEFIEKNESLLKYSDLSLYEHQKEIFTVSKKPTPQLILYMAPTGTGKTLTPIALSEQKRVIFVCAARHVGLALARAAISVNKKIAFAFGCASADDIRLHYFAAKEYTKNKRSGGIGKVDNSVGDNVEIMICDIKSYLPAMYYMLAFNEAKNIVLYWDEPTITLDYTDHEFHNTIRKNWKKNIIPNIVLSSATLPKLNELTETIPDFLNKCKHAEICNIVSHDCKKSIPMINKDGYVVLPHYLSQDYADILKIAKHCESYFTLLRYFDLKEVVQFVTFVNKQQYANKKMRVDIHFETLDDLDMKHIKMYYVTLLQNILPEKWSAIYAHVIQTRRPRIMENSQIDPKGNKITKTKSVSSASTSQTLSGAPISRLASEQPFLSTKENNTSASCGSGTGTGTSGVYVTTKDAYTLTEGPTIFISNEIEKIAKFCIQQANIPGIVMDEIMKKIEYNNVLNERLQSLESEMEFIKERAEKNAKNNVSEKHKGLSIKGRNKSSKDSKKINRECGEEQESKGEIGKLTHEINSLRSMIKVASLNDTFVPNKKMHLDKWAQEMETKGAFTSNIDETVIGDIMALNGVDNLWKILLMMGIGVFINHDNITYTEIMKKMADEQKLYMIIASSDYIYGTNYQFCHGYLAKDLDLTQEKIIQAMGRIGRNNIQQTYTLRFRDDAQILKLFTSETEKPEIINMNKLFNTKKVVWKDNQYIEIEDEEDQEEESCEEMENNIQEDEDMDFQEIDKE
jgi:hypothetical protein